MDRYPVCQRPPASNWSAWPWNKQEVWGSARIAENRTERTAVPCAVFIESNGVGREPFLRARERGLRVVFVTRNVEHYLREPGMAEAFQFDIDEVLTCETN